MCDHYATTVNDSGVEDAYYCNLDKLYEWIELLEKPRDSEPRSAPDLTGEKIKGQDFAPDLNSSMIEALPTIRAMLDIEPTKRPAARGLWENFQHVSSEKCRDCDPRLPDEVWTPNRRQKDAMESGTSRRRSMQLIPEEASDNPSTDTRDGQPENENLLGPNYRPDRNSLMGRRASSPHTGRFRFQTPPSRLHDLVPIHPPIPAYPKPFNPSAPVLPAEDDTQITRTLSATDSRRANTHENPTGSRSMSPRQRRPHSETRLQYGKAQGPGTIVSALTPKRDMVIPNPPAASRSEPNPVAQSSVGSSHSLTVNKQAPKPDMPEVQEKPSTNGDMSHQKKEHLQTGTQIIIYDLADKEAYVAAYAQLKGTTPLFPLSPWVPF